MDYTRISTKYLFTINDGMKAVIADKAAFIEMKEAAKAVKTAEAIFHKAAEAFDKATEELEKARADYSLDYVRQNAEKAALAACVKPGDARLYTDEAEKAAREEAEKAARLIGMYEKRVAEAEQVKREAVSDLMVAEKEAARTAEAARKTGKAVSEAARPLFEIGMNPATKELDIVRLAKGLGIIDGEPSKKDVKKYLPVLANYLAEARTIHVVKREDAKDSLKSFKTAARELIFGLYEACRASGAFDIMSDGYLLPREDIA